MWAPNPAGGVGREAPPWTSGHAPSPHPVHHVSRGVHTPEWLGGGPPRPSRTCSGLHPCMQGKGCSCGATPQGEALPVPEKNGLGRCPWWVGGQVGWFHGGLGPCALSAGTGDSAALRAAASLPDEGEGAGAAAPGGTAPSKACSLRRPSRPELGHLGSRCEALLLGVACTGNFCAWTCPR